MSNSSLFSRSISRKGLFSLGFLVLLSGCSSTSPDSDMSEGDSLETTSEASRAPTISEIFTASDRRVWYAVFDGIGKSSEIYMMYVVENGAVTLYKMSGYGIGLTLGDLQGYDDQAAINTIEQNVDRSFEESGHLYDSYEDCRAAQITDNQTPEFILNTDETGNNIQSETVILQPDKNSYTTVLNIANGSSFVSGEVYDDVYRGFEMIPESGSRMKYIVTRDESFTAFSLDDFDSPNVVIN